MICILPEKNYVIWGEGSNEKCLGIIAGILGIVLAVIGIVLKQKENAAVSVIGGADGPTSIYIAGKLNGDNFVFLIVIGIILLVLAGILGLVIQKR